MNNDDNDDDDDDDYDDVYRERVFWDRLIPGDAVTLMADCR
jgi:hypothetical protein